MEFYSVIRKMKPCGLKINGYNWRDIMLSEVSWFRKTKAACFSHMWKIAPKDKHIHKTKHDHIQTYM
jgi:hypothetical protein